MDLDSIEETSSCLKALLKKSKIHGHKAFAQVEKLKHLGVAFKGVEEVQKKFKNIVEYPKIKDREETKSKKGALTDNAIYVAANESYGCAQFA